jgi:hypothetical protein
MTLKMDERSSQKWPAKLLSSMASLHKNGFGFTILQHFSSSEPVPRLPRTFGLYRLEFGNNLPTFPQDMASKRAQDPPIMAKISQKQLKNQIKS